MLSLENTFGKKHAVVAAAAAAAAAAAGGVSGAAGAAAAAAAGLLSSEGAAFEASLLPILSEQDVRDFLVKKGHANPASLFVPQATVPHARRWVGI